MLKAAKIRSCAPVLNLVISELNGYPVGVKYHRKCYQIFTHKLHLERLSKKSEQIQLQDKRNNDRLLAKLEETDTYITWDNNKALFQFIKSEFVKRIVPPASKQIYYIYSVIRKSSA